jgi:hypothetical protein
MVHYENIVSGNGMAQRKGKTVWSWIGRKNVPELLSETYNCCFNCVHEGFIPKIFYMFFGGRERVKKTISKLFLKFLYCPLSNSRDSLVFFHLKGIVQRILRGVNTKLK